MCKKLIYLSCCFLILGLVQSANAQSANLVGWWKLDDMSGNIALDSSGNELHGTLSEPNSPDWVEGYRGGSLWFDLGDYVDLGNPDELNFGTNDWTLSAWINTVAEGQGESFVCPIICNGGDWTGGIRYAVTMNDYSNGLITIVLDDDVTKVVLTGTATVNDGKWHHIAVTREDTTLSLYVDSVQDGNNVGDIPAGYDLSGTSQHNAYIGALADHRDGALNKLYRDGQIDDVRIFNVALSQDEVEAVMMFNMRGNPLLAWKANPLPGQTDVPLDEILSWKAGTDAQAHDVYFGIDVNDVTNASRDNSMDVLVSQNQTGTTYNVPLTYNQTYYWRVDEINDENPDSPWKGDIWSFTVLNHIVIEDFEDYNDWEPDTIYLAWVDGYENPANGSTSGYPEPEFTYGEHFVETDIVHGGAQSMPLFYDNTAAPISEATKDLTAITNWTQDDVATLRIWHYGDPNNTPEPMYVKLNNSGSVVNDNPNAAQIEEWTEWIIDLQAFADLGVSLTSVTSMTIGFGDGLPGGAGMVFFDDIRLYRPEE